MHAAKRHAVNCRDTALLPLLSGGLRVLQLELEPQQQTALLRYIALLHRWNRTYNLTAVREPALMLSYHVLDVLAALPYLPTASPQRVLDIGSGCGAPGIALAIACPHWQVVLLDSNQKKATFLRHAALALPLPNVVVVQERVEAYQVADPFDLITARAVDSVTTLLEWTQALLASEGRWSLFKGKDPSCEINNLPADCHLLAVNRLFCVDKERHLVQITQGPRGTA